MIRIFQIVAVVLVVALPMAGANQLKHHPSPYLALHGDDPVAWYPWGAEALEKARRENKLIFVSVGYFSCHWCHVMQRESFADPAIAKVLNRHYVSVKVDRELNPALDDRLMDFVQATSGRGGWPMNVFLTPDGYPVAGLTYASPGRFMRIIEDLQQRWQSDGKALAEAARDVDRELADRRSRENALLDDTSPARFAEPFRQALLRVADTLKGGFGDQAKFPSVPQLWALLQLSPQADSDEFLRLTLDVMATHGLRDAIGGGFFRYTVDPDWETPHYEKMLYTNALLAMLYFEASERYKEPRYREIALDTLRFMGREMAASGGAYIASLSAVDDEGREGAYYLWSQKQLRRYLTPEEMDLVNVGWAMNRYEGEDAEVLPLQLVSDADLARQFDMPPAKLKAKMQVIREKLQRARAQTRSLPRDEKRLAGWNGMALAALADAADDRVLRARGEALRQFIDGLLWDGKQLSRAVDGRGESMGPGGLSDYAWTALGLLRWADATGNEEAARLGHRLVREAWQRFHSDKGWRETEKTLLPNPIHQRHIPDGALPSPEVVLLRATRSSLRERPDAALQKRLDTALAATTRSLEESLYWYGSLVAVAVKAAAGPQVNSATPQAR